MKEQSMKFTVSLVVVLLTNILTTGVYANSQVDLSHTEAPYTTVLNNNYTRGEAFISDANNISSNVVGSDKTEYDNITGESLAAEGLILRNSIENSMAEQEELAAETEIGDVINIADYNIYMSENLSAAQLKNNWEMFKLALEHSQNRNLPLYFPDNDRPYNLGYSYNYSNLDVEEDLIIIGQSRTGTKIINAPGLNAKQSIRIENISISLYTPRTYAFLNIKPNTTPEGSSHSYEIYINNIQFSDQNLADNCTSRFFSINLDVAGRGYKNVTITNNIFKKCQIAININYECNSGLVENNIIEDLGIATEATQLNAIVIGSIDCYVTDFTVRNNYIKGMHNKFITYIENDENVNSYASGMRGILVYGENSPITGNYLEDIMGGAGHTGIYTMSLNAIIEDNILNNVCGTQGSITHKVGSASIIGNKVYYRTSEYPDLALSAVGIYVEAAGDFEIRDNYVNFEYTVGVDVNNKASYLSTVVFDNNYIICNGRRAVTFARSNKELLITNNTIMHTAPPGVSLATLVISNLYEDSHFEISGNKIKSTVNTCLMLPSIISTTQYVAKSAYGDIYNNEFNVVEGNESFFLGAVRYKFHHNTIMYNNNADFDGNANGKRSIITSELSYGEQYIKNNVFNYNSKHTGYLIQFIPRKEIEADEELIFDISNNTFNAQLSENLEGVILLSTMTDIKLGDKVISVIGNDMEGDNGPYNFFFLALFDTPGKYTNVGTLILDNNDVNIWGCLLNCKPGLISGESFDFLKVTNNKVKVALPSKNPIIVNNIPNLSGEKSNISNNQTIPFE